MQTLTIRQALEIQEQVSVPLRGRGFERLIGLQTSRFHLNVSVPLRGRGFESMYSNSSLERRKSMQVSVPLRGRGFERWY